MHIYSILQKNNAWKGNQWYADVVGNGFHTGQWAEWAEEGVAPFIYKRSKKIIAVEPSAVTPENFQVLWKGHILKRKKQEILSFGLMACLYHEQHNRNFEKQLSSLVSGGAGPPHFQSPDLHLFLEPEPSRRWPALRCGLCHSDLSSFLVTSRPLCLAGACSHPTPPCSLPFSAMLLQAQVRAAERLEWTWADVSSVFPSGTRGPCCTAVTEDDVFYLLS